MRDHVISAIRQSSFFHPFILAVKIGEKVNSPFFSCSGFCLNVSRCSTFWSMFVEVAAAYYRPCLRSSWPSLHYNTHTQTHTLAYLWGESAPLYAQPLKSCEYLYVDARRRGKKQVDGWMDKIWCWRQTLGPSPVSLS